MRLYLISHKHVTCFASRRPQWCLATALTSLSHTRLMPRYKVAMLINPTRVGQAMRYTKLKRDELFNFAHTLTTIYSNLFKNFQTQLGNLSVQS